MSSSPDPFEKAVNQFFVPTYDAAELALKFIEISKDNLKACTSVYRKGLYADSADRLQQSVEKAAKSFGLLIGTLNPKGKELQNVGHKSYKALLLNFWPFYQRLNSLLSAILMLSLDSAFDRPILRRYKEPWQQILESLKKSAPDEAKLREDLKELKSLKPSAMWKASMELDTTNKWIADALKGLDQKPIISETMEAGLRAGGGALASIGRLDARSSRRLVLIINISQASQLTFSLAMLTAWHLSPARYPPVMKRDYWQAGAYTKSAPFVKSIPRFAKHSTWMIDSINKAARTARILTKNSQ